ncbi:hypothetical protein HG531_011695 [Fusarium graminearum]|nr:hypothetical protein HG531_011695 [Fusarium graminearum]
MQAHDTDRGNIATSARHTRDGDWSPLRHHLDATSVSTVEVVPFLALLHALEHLIELDLVFSKNLVTCKVTVVLDYRIVGTLQLLGLMDFFTVQEHNGLESGDTKFLGLAEIVVVKDLYIQGVAERCDDDVTRNEIDVETKVVTTKRLADIVDGRSFQEAHFNTVDMRERDLQLDLESHNTREGHILDNDVESLADHGLSNSNLKHNLWVNFVLELARSHIVGVVRGKAEFPVHHDNIVLSLGPSPPPKTATSQEVTHANMMTPVLWYQSGLVSDFYALTAGIDAYHRIEYPEAVTRPRLRDQADYLAPLHRPLAIPAAEPILFLSMVLLRFQDRHRLQVVFGGAGAIIDVGDYGSALGASALLKLTWNGLRRSIVSFFGLSFLLFWARIRIESESSDAGIPRRLNDGLLGIICGDVALGIGGGLNDTLLLELFGFSGG